MTMSDLTKFALRAILLGAIAACSGRGRMPVVPTGTCPVAGAPAVPARVLAEPVGDPRCPDWGCGANSPIVGDGIAFDELDSSGAPAGAHGIQIVKVTREGPAPEHATVQVQLRVERHELIVTDAAGREYRHGDLMGTVITLRSDLGSHELKIVRVQEQELTFWAREKEPVPAYEIQTRPLGDQRDFQVSICKSGIAMEPEWGATDHYAIAFAGDHYDARHKLVSNSAPGTTLFNLACAGTAPAKMHLMRHTNAGADVVDRAGVLHRGVYPTTTDQRQAMLKMFTADYCGTGHAFTVDGQRLMYGDSNHWYPETPTPAVLASPLVRSIEAKWTPDGAACLDLPRLSSIAEVHCECPDKPLPRCGGPAGVLRWEAGFHVISANPVPPAAGAP